MTNYTSEPIEPFDVRPKANMNSTSPGAPAGGSGATKPSNHKNPSGISQDLVTVWGKTGVTVLLAGLFVLVQSNPLFGGLGILLLLGGVLFRLDSRFAKIATAPIILSSVLLISEMARGCPDIARNGYRFQSPVLYPDGEALLLPLFLAGCLFYMPDFPTYTEKIVLGMSLLMLVSGLLPCSGYVIVFITMKYYLFIAIVVGLGIDFAQTGGSLNPQTPPAGK